MAFLRQEWVKGWNGVGCHFLLKAVFPTQRSNLYILQASPKHCRWILYQWALEEAQERYQFRSVRPLSHTQLCDPMDCSMPGLSVHHQLLEFTQTHVHWVGDAIQLSRWCHPTISSSVFPFSSSLQSFLESGSFQMSQLFASGGQSIGVSASTAVLPMNIQDGFPLGWTGWISLQSKGLSRVFSITI